MFQEQSIKDKKLFYDLNSNFLNDDFMTSDHKNIHLIVIASFLKQLDPVLLQAMKLRVGQ